MPHRSKHVSFYTLLCLIASFMCILLVPSSARANASKIVGEYKLRAGDILEISVVGIPELRDKMRVEMDGYIIVPLCGRVQAAGLGISELSRNISNLLSSKKYYQKSPDGRTASIPIGPDEVVVRIAEYTPVYLAGDVAKPGEHPFRPGMTVRQAIALAGGVDPLRSLAGDARNELLTLINERETSLMSLAQTTVAVQRLRAELAGATTIDIEPARRLPISPQVLDQIVKSESGELSARATEISNDKSTADRMVRQLTARLQVLNEQLSKEDEGVKSDQEELDRSRELFEKGTVAIPRLTEARRALLLSATRALQTRSQIVQYEKERDDLQQRLQKAKDSRRVQIYQALQEAETRLNLLKARYQTANAKLLRTYPDVTFVQSNNKVPAITIHRSSDSGRQQLVADEDWELLPGDAVDIKLAGGKLSSVEDSRSAKTY